MPVSADTLRNKLSLKFELVCFVDLAEIAHQHSAIFSLLEHHHKEQYTPDQRLVFYTSHQPDQKFLNHLQRAVSSVDVSNFFVVICTPYDISNELQQANQLYGHDSSVINWISVELEATADITSDNFYPYDTTCPLPFTSLFVGVDGVTTPCCKFKYSTGNIYNNTLNDIFWNSDTQKIKDQMQQGIKPDGCGACWHIENRGGTSLRQHAIDKFGKQVDRGWIDNLSIRDISIVPSSLCNFKCRICGPVASSQIAVEELRHADTVSNTLELKQFLKFARSDLDEVTQQSLLEIQNTLEYLHVLGGEPFMLPGLEELLNKIIASGNSKHIQLEFNTNGSVWPANIVGLFDQFNKVEILVSIDNTGSMFEVERGGTWENVEHHIRQFAALPSQHVSTKLCVTVNIQNLLYLDNLVKFADNVGIDIVWIYLENPKHLCIDHVTQTVKDLVYQKYHNHSNSELAGISMRLQNASLATGQEFLQYTDMIDQRRGQKFFKTHPEIYAAMGGQINR
jgi:radical SAM protein with 4Fe4S-binding SPASM domain